MQIVVQQDDGDVGRRALQVLAHPRKEVVPLLVRGEIERWPNVRKELAERGNKARNLRRAISKRRAKAPWRHDTRAKLELLDQRMIGGRTFHLVAVAHHA